MNNKPIRIILADDHKLSRESWSMLLGFDERFEVIHTSDNGQDAIDKSLQLRPDIVVLDINMYPVDGFQAVRSILAADPTMKVIGISINNHPSYADRMLELGARGFIIKGSSFDTIADTIVSVHAGNVVSVQTH